jgi:Heme exporter protein D (CcmD)
MTHWHFIGLSYLVFFLGLLFDWWYSSSSLRRLKRELQARKRREQALKSDNSVPES